MKIRDRFIAEVIQCAGEPYRWGACGPEAFDCCGLVQWGMARIGRPFNRDICSADLYNIYHDKKVLEPAALQGSLWLYSNTADPSKITHVMIMLKRWAPGQGTLIGSRGGGSTTLTLQNAIDHRAFVDVVMTDYWHQNLVFIVDPFAGE